MSEQKYFTDNDKELQFFLDLMAHYSLSGSVFSEKEVFFNFGFSKEILSFFNKHEFPDFLSLIPELKDSTVYYYNDKICSRYIFIKLPDSKGQVLMLGPYTTIPYSREAVLAICEKNNLAPDQYKVFDQYFQLIPHFPDENFLMASVNTFAEHLWKGDKNYSVESIYSEPFHRPLPLTTAFSDIESFDQLLTAGMLEKRYAIENQLLSIISQGQLGKLDQFIMRTDYQLPVEMRISDPLRNQKNYLIIFNTLLRKAAEQGGLHPIYINDVSKDFFIKIEALHSLSESVALQKNMMRKYCLLVHNHSMKNYSLLVQRVIILVDSDLTADLSLSSMAETLNVNASYLSSHFHKETGQTLTGFVNSRRIDHAIMLLNTTALQIQTISQYCGISDINYFTRIFKKIVGMTPSQYREAIR